jgi:hypothetical protein
MNIILDLSIALRFLDAVFKKLDLFPSSDVREQSSCWVESVSKSYSWLMDMKKALSKSIYNVSCIIELFWFRDSD